MATYSITYACGHRADKHLYGRETERHRYIDWAAANASCPACHVNDRAKALECAEMEHALPPLVGSEKQIAWARQIRAAKIAEVEAWIERSILPRVAADKMDLYQTQRAGLMQGLYKQTRASWWIERRELHDRQLADAAVLASKES